MRKLWVCVMCLACVAGTVLGNDGGSVFDRIAEDHRNFYSWGSLGYMAGGLFVGGVLANTDADQEFQDWFQDDFRGDITDDLADGTKELGEGRIMIPFLAGASLLGLLADENESFGVVGEWGVDSLRAMLVGGPPVLAFQRVLGAARPTDPDDSSWDPFNDENGVSGHAFIGAVPFLTAARMTDSWLLKGGFYAGSALCAFSRVNDDDHYLSQSLLGWWFAAVATDAVGRSDEPEDVLALEPVLYRDITGVALSMRF